MQIYKKKFEETILNSKKITKSIFRNISEKFTNLRGKPRKNYLARLSNKQQIFFIKRLSFLIKAGVPISESLYMIREQTISKSYLTIVDSLIEDTTNGKFLSVGLARFKRAFGEFSINIIAVGEATGILSENLEYLADELQKKQTLRRKIIGAFIYPIVVTIATFGITSFLMIYLFPKIMPVFLSLRIELPLSTRIVLAISNFLINYGWLVIAFLIISGIAFAIALKKNETFHYYTDRYLLKLPIVGQIIQFYNLSTATRTLGLLLKGGITASDAIPIVVKTTDNRVYKKEFENLSKCIDRGEKMSTYLSTRRKLFPDVLSQITSVGERSGSLSISLIYLSKMYEEEVDDFTKNLSSMIEPVMMIFMGIMVGFIAISIITPIYSITQNLHP